MLNMRSQYNKQIKEKTESVSEFLSDQKEIFTKNFLTDLLKTEANQIRNTENQITKSLQDSTLKLDNDYKSFMGFIDNEKEINKRNEDVTIIYNDLLLQGLVNCVSQNKELINIKKRLATMDKQLKEDIDRVVKSIMVFKGYAIFLHKDVMNSKLN